jgi:LacI family transcriptional regulator, galactose operon repressor
MAGMPKMSDVARRAGVSTATVSRVLSGPPDVVRTETRDKVLRAVAETGYFPNRLARNLRERSARIFALVISDIGNPFFTAVARGFEDAARAGGYSVIIADTDEMPDFEAQRLLDMVAEGVAGIVLASTGKRNEGLEQVVRSGIPVVALDRRIGAEFDTVTSDGASGAHEAVSALIEAGNRRVALVGGPAEISSMVDRRAGYERALREHGIAVDQDLIVHGDMREESGQLVASSLLDAKEPPSAIFVANNLMAVGTLKAIAERGLGIPGDVAVVCFDDFAASELISPGIAVVVQPTYQLGVAAAEMLLRRIEQPSAPVREAVLSPKLLARPSIGTRA